MFCLVSLFAMMPLSAWAISASNTQIINNASMTYNDGASSRTANATPVTVTVTLVPGQPTGTPGAPQTKPYTAVDTSVDNTFTIVAANTNGPDYYSLVTNVTGSTNTTGASAAVTSPASPVFLGATVTLSGSTTLVLNVPSDGISNSEVNGIAGGDTVVVNGEARLVASVTDNASGTSTITLSTALSTAPAAGVLVAEQKIITVTVKSGTITTAGTSVTVSKNLVVTSVTAPTITTTLGPITDTYTSGLATLNKYVRNVTTPAAGTGTSVLYNTFTYYPSGITAKPGEVLEYLLVANNNGSGNVSAAAITDTLPINYVALKTLAYNGNTSDFTYFNESGTASYLSSAADSDAATFASPILTINVGTGATNAAGGTIAAGATVRALYRVTVNP
jgi:hypothetical protein